MGPRGNFWVGLGLLHALFIREHNAICDALRREHGDWSDDELYDKARLITAAVMAKIHTVEWTPAIIAHPTTERGMHANWYGIAGERVRRKFGRLGPNDVLSGIPGSPTDHHGVPYSLTEEFVSVYRMHPLIPDEFEFTPLDGAAATRVEFAEIGPGKWRQPLGEIGVADAFYSFAISHPGALVLHNYPTSFIRDFRPDPDGPPVDLATVDILRDRERGVPRYNEFRTLMHRKPVASFEELASDPEVAAQLQDVYGHVDRVDTHGGAVRGAAPPGLRLLRHGVPRVPPDGVAAAEERPLLHDRLPSRGVHADRDSSGSTTRRCRRSSCATIRSLHRSSGTTTPSSPGRTRAPDTHALGSFPTMAGKVLTTLDRNRALLARQLLLERSKLPLVRAVERVAGIQAQYAPSSYIGLWSRLERFGLNDLTRALEQRRVVQGTLLRSTIHLVSAGDYWAFALGSRSARQAAWLRFDRKRLSSSDLKAAAKEVRKELAGGVGERGEMLALARERDPERPTHLWNGLSAWVDLVRAPPSGTWERRRADLYALADEWIGPPDVTPEEAVETLLSRYLRGFGPARLADAANWAGLPTADLEPAAERLTLRRFATRRTGS